MFTVNNDVDIFLFSRALVNLIKILFYTKSYDRNNTTIPMVFEKTAERHKSKPCVLFKDEVWTFGDIQGYANQIANLFASQGYSRGDVVAVFMENCPQYMPMWLGMNRSGVVAALVNFNLRDMSLAHCIKVSSTGHRFQHKMGIGCLLTLQKIAI